METISLGTPVVSVVMATYNEPAKIIHLAIESILEQTLQNLELLIIDDSTDTETINAINYFEIDSRVILIRKQTRIGFVKALNIGLNLARGRYIARMDGDDISERNRMEIQASFLDQNSQYSVVGGSMNIMNEEGIITNKRTYPRSSVKLNLWSIFRSPISHPTMMMRRELVELGYLYDESFQKAEDLELWLRLMKNGYKFYNLSDILLTYRISENFASKRSGNHLINNYRARYKNFSWKYPVRSILSICTSRAYLLLPESIVKRIYSKENN